MTRYESRIFAFGSSFRSRPRSSTPNSTEAFGAPPLNGDANTCIDISLQPFDGSTQHAESSVVRGSLPAAALGGGTASPH